MCLGGYLWGCCPPIPIHVHPSRPPPMPFPQPVPQPPKKQVIPLTGVEVRSKVVDMCAEVTLVQRYENIEDVPIEATYVFPLEERASVSSFYAIVDGKKVMGKLFEKEKAKDTYEDAIASGNSAYMLEQEEDAPNSFKTSIGNLPPKSEVVISIVYITDLQFNSDQKLEFIIPTNTKAFPDGVVNRRFATPTVKNDSNIPFGLKVEIDFEMTSKIKSVSSPSHPIQYEAGDKPTQAKVTLANEDVGVPLVKNFELNIALAEPNKPIVRVQGDTCMLALYPDLSSDDDPITEMIFLVDRSGSMSGAKIQRVKDTLQIFLRSLPLGTLFNIVGFGSNYVSLFDKSKEYDDDTLAAATKHVTDMKANLGGTNLLNPMRIILNSEPREGIPRQLFILTDGEVDNTEDCVDFVRYHSNTTRVFAFGIHGASPDLVNGIAKAGEGKAELILGNENIENKVMAQLKRALQPALTNIRVDWNTLQATQTPLKLPPLFSGSRVIIYGTLPKTATKGTVTFKADTAKGPYNFSVEVDPADVFPGDFIPKLAARSMIRDLEEGRRKTNYQKTAIDESTKKQIIALSLKYGMMSKYTAFVAVNENDKAVEGTMESRNVNQQLGLTRDGLQLNQQQQNQPLLMNMIHMMPPTIPGAIIGGRGPAPPPDVSRPYAPPAKAYYDSADFRMAEKGKAAPPAAVVSPRRSSATLSKKSESEERYSGSVLQSRSTSPRSSNSSSWAAPPPPLSFGHADLLFDAGPSLSAPPAAPSFSAPSRSLAGLQMAPAPQSLASAASSAPMSSSDSAGIKAIVMKQKAAGNFTVDVLAEAPVPNLSIEKLRANTPESLKSVPADILDQVLVILVICGLFQKRYAGDREQWELVEKKGITWVKKECKKLSLPDDMDWKAMATKLASSVGIN
eukprot:Phypoly_transcript_02563.p1 GENE.Phypoly_transcript_02563~~Phypoly_transcript_02563.p1  ORF type:complete len:905 (+),score=178.71 Phypoly_transcript_02563:1-2715(+)